MQLLDRADTERFQTDQFATLVVGDRGRGNFGGIGRSLVDEHGEGQVRDRRVCLCLKYFFRDGLAFQIAQCPRIQ